MQVAVLQQFLRSLLNPLKASNASAQTISALERTCQELESFRDKNLADLADFLARAGAYEREGHWPKGHPAIAGHVVDDPSVPDYANRLRDFRARVNVPGSSLLQTLDTELTKLGKSLSVKQIKELTASLEIPAKVKSKPDGLAKIRAFMLGSTFNPPSSGQRSSPLPQESLDRIVETLKALKAKADTPDAPFDEIDAELHSLEARLGAKEAIAAAKGLGILRTITNRAEALEAIRRKVLEMKLARERIAY